MVEIMLAVQETSPFGQGCFIDGCSHQLLHFTSLHEILCYNAGQSTHIATLFSRFRLSSEEAMRSLLLGL